jgi:hypothetical protein
MNLTEYFQGIIDMLYNPGRNGQIEEAVGERNMLCGSNNPILNSYISTQSVFIWLNAIDMLGARIN